MAVAQFLKVLGCMWRLLGSGKGGSIKQKKKVIRGENVIWLFSLKPTTELSGFRRGQHTKENLSKTRKREASSTCCQSWQWLVGERSCWKVKHRQSGSQPHWGLHLVYPQESICTHLFPETFAYESPITIPLIPRVVCHCDNHMLVLGLPQGSRP